MNNDDDAMLRVTLTLRRDGGVHSMTELPMGPVSCGELLVLGMLQAESARVGRLFKERDAP